MDNIATLIREGNIEAAEAELGKMSAGTGGSADVHYKRGLVLEAKGDHEAAIDAYEEAVEADENHADATFHLALAHDLHGNEERALELYESLSDHTPAFVSALLNLAVLYEDLGRYEDALDCVQRVINEYPNHTRARLFMKDLDSSLDMVYDENQERVREKRNAILDTPISDFELSVRSRNCLKKMNINSLGDLLRITEAELLAYKNFGETSLNEIKVMLKQKGLRLGQLREEESQGPNRSSSSSRATAPQGAPEILTRYLTEIELSGRSRKCLQRLNLMTVGDLVNKSETELLSTKNFGQTSLNEIKQKLVELGLSLRKKPE